MRTHTSYSRPWSNQPDVTKLYKKQRYYVFILTREVKKEYFEKHIPHDSPYKIFGNFIVKLVGNKKTSFLK